MPLFTSRKDSGFLKGINRELLHKVISNEIALYQISIEKSQKNIYQESTSKVYNQPVRLFALIRVEDKASNDSEYGVNFTKLLTVGFAKDDLRDKNLYLYAGDIIEYDNSYFEINVVKDSTNYWAGKNPNSSIGIENDGWPVSGYDHSIMCECNLTNVSNLNLVNIRTDSNIEKNDSSIPKNI